MSRNRRRHRPGKDAKPSGYKVLSLGDLLALPIPPREHLIMPWLKQAESAMVYAPPGVGKSMFALSLAVAIAGGGPFLSWAAPKPRRVLVVDGEMHMEDIKDRADLILAKQAGTDEQQARKNLMVFARQWQRPEIEFPDLATEEGRRVVENMAAHCDLVILDNLSTLATLEDENAASSFNDIKKLLAKLKQRNIACILIHHTGKSKTTYRGSSMLATTFEVIIGLEQTTGKRAATGTAFSIRWEKYRGQRDSSIRAWDAWLDAEGWHHEVSPHEEIDRMLEELETGLYGTQSALAEALGKRPDEITRLKKKAIASGRIEDHRWQELLEVGRMGDEDAPARPDF